MKERNKEKLKKGERQRKKHTKTQVKEGGETERETYTNK
jgi:hypothetical protein